MRYSNIFKSQNLNVEKEKAPQSEPKQDILLPMVKYNFVFHPSPTHQQAASSKLKIPSIKMKNWDTLQWASDCLKYVRKQMLQLSLWRNLKSSKSLRQLPTNQLKQMCWPSLYQILSIRTTLLQYASLENGSLIMLPLNVTFLMTVEKVYLLIAQYHDPLSADPKLPQGHKTTVCPN